MNLYIYCKALLKIIKNKRTWSIFTKIRLHLCNCRFDKLRVCPVKANSSNLKNHFWNFPLNISIKFEIQDTPKKETVYRIRSKIKSLRIVKIYNCRIWERVNDVMVKLIIRIFKLSIAEMKNLKLNARQD